MIKSILGAAAAVAMIVAAFIAFTMEHHWKGNEAIRPAASEFGFGPRVSAGQRYAATLQPRQALRVRQLQAVPVLVTDASGRPIEGASISVTGGMPEHGHGLPTQPKVRNALGPACTRSKACASTWADGGNSSWPSTRRLVSTPLLSTSASKRP